MDIVMPASLEEGASFLLSSLQGARYAVELSRQLADFLEKPLQQSGGIMTLPDVFCL